MTDKAFLRKIVRDNLPDIVEKVNAALEGREIEKLHATLQRVGRDGVIPHWYEQLRSDRSLPNLDGKTIGSVVEMLFLAVLEVYTFNSVPHDPLKINPARGVDFPGLDLGCKSPSENFCTSEPFFSAYERLYGGEYDVVVLLTDYQSKKKKPPLRLQIVDARYLEKSEIADRELCRIALKNREYLLSMNEAWAKKVFRFLAFVNQSDWRARHLLPMVEFLQDDRKIRERVEAAAADFQKKNSRRLKDGDELIPQEDLDAIRRIIDVRPLQLGVVDAVDNWIVDVLKDAARLANDNEWGRLKASPLNGKIGLSFALQWRFNFGNLFSEGAKAASGEGVGDQCGNGVVAK